MKIILNPTELAKALQATYPTPPGYRVVDASISKYSNDFCTIELAPDVPAPAAEPTVNVLPLEAA